MSDQILTVSASPHIHSEETVANIMYSVVLALMPAAVFGIYLFGLAALKVLLVSIMVSVLSEAIIQKAMGKELTISDGSAVVTGLLLALTLPASSPWWMVAIGAFMAIFVGKQVFGGLGHNIFNPALVGRAILLVSWPAQMTRWSNPGRFLVDAISGATPLGLLKTQGVLSVKDISFLTLFIGNKRGCIGEVSIILLLTGAIYLLYKGHISWHIPLSYIFSIILFTGIFWLINPIKYAPPLFHLLTGGLILGAFFMATDMVTTPVTSKGMIIFGTGCGILTGIFRLFSVYPEGVTFAILIMNSITPLINRYIRPMSFGRKK
ncbi:MAG: RnfABCDGE type electron transport complex subunit D [bacterium]